MPQFMSDAWVSALTERLNNSAAYKSAGKGWKTTLALAVLPEPEKSIEAAAMVIALEDGACKHVERIEGPGPYEAEYVIRGLAENWKKLLTKEVFPVPAIMKGDLQLVKGGTTALMMKMNAVQALLDEAGAVPTEYSA